MAQTFGQPQQQVQQPQPPEYTLPGVLHFLQSEWRRYERDRNEWEIERAEMKARIALLEGERRGIEKMKTDLMKRVKMLEFALRQERSKYLAGLPPTRESSNVSTPANEEGPELPVTLNNTQSLKSSSTMTSILNSASLQYKCSTSNRDPNYRIKSRELLKACLQEIDYLTDAATNNLSVNNRISTYPSSSDGYPLSNHSTGLDGNSNATRKPDNRYNSIFIGDNINAYNGASPKNPDDVSFKPSRPAPTSPATVSPILSANSSSPPLNYSMPLSESSSSISVEREGRSFPSYSGGEFVKSGGRSSNYEQSSPTSPEFEVNSSSDIQSSVNNGIVKESEFLSNHNTSTIHNKAKNEREWKTSNHVKNRSKFISKSADEIKEEEEQLTKDVQKKFGLSDVKVTKLLKNANKRKSQEILAINTSDPQLDELSFNIEEEENTQKSEENGSDHKMWRQRFTLRSHLDSVRSLSWHKTELTFLSGSEDGTVKLWDLKGPLSHKPASVPDIEPTMTYRGHTAAVNSVVMASEQRRCYSASMDATIRVWNFPSPKRDTYGPVDPSLNLTTYIGHTDAIWDLRLFPMRNQNTQLLASASADGTVKIWDTEAEGSPLKCSWSYYGVNSEESVNGEGRPPIPTSVDFVHSDLKKIAVSYQNSIIKLFDIKSGQSILDFKSDDTYDNTPATQINRIIVHPTMSLIFSAHEDKYIRFFDINSGKCTYSMHAHLDSVTSLDIDPSGMILLSGGHDSSIRLWDIVSTRHCIQEFVTHRRKSDEGVLSVQYHPSLPWIASGGADSIVKIYC
ncbi:9848_t:CDS:10 [Funneliformis geosporum]|uniref:16154_t:CDS:1 n=1 Tax=Funneliformis geosporum TaxID=1117311 RepID=A0A9W4SRU6_9GLOM|nr:16154_t:CDS:10 [Funneliformis geosporum]CAI2181819.1 9848_t:CDS:10 [Funneliformis geosporum]